MVYSLITLIVRMIMKQVTIQELLALIPDAFLPEKASGMQAAIQLNILGEGGGEWYISIQNAICLVKAGKIENARISLEASAQDILAIIGGSLDPGVAFMTGRLRARGDMAFAYRLTDVFQITPQIREILNG